MTEYLTQIIKVIVDQPEQVEVARQVQGQTLLFQVRVAPEDAGKVIGKEGRVINALRLLVKAGCGRRFTRANIEVSSEGPPAEAPA